MASSIHACRIDGSAIGEFSEEEFRRKIFANEIGPEDYYWREGMADWAAVSSYRVARDPAPPFRPRLPGSSRSSIQPAITAETRASGPPRWLIVTLSTIAGLLVIGMILQGNSSKPSKESLAAPQVHVAASGLALYLTNKGTPDNWTEAVVYLNDHPPFTYKWSGAAPQNGATITIPLSEFVKEDGERFDGFRRKVTQVWVGGSGYDYVGYSMQ